jgi:hypothetical protein
VFTFFGKLFAFSRLVHLRSGVHLSEAAAPLCLPFQLRGLLRVYLLREIVRIFTISTSASTNDLPFVTRGPGPPGAAFSRLAHPCPDTPPHSSQHRVSSCCTNAWGQMLNPGHLHSEVASQVKRVTHPRTQCWALNVGGVLLSHNYGSVFFHGVLFFACENLIQNVCEPKIFPSVFQHEKQQ